MSDFGLLPVPLMSPDNARDVARAYKALAGHLTELGVTREAGRLERQSYWWLSYAQTLASSKPPD